MQRLHDVARWFFAFPVKARVFSLLFGQKSYKASHASSHRCNAAASAIRSITLCTRFRSQIRLQQRSTPCDMQRLVEPLGTVCMEASPARRRCRSVRCTPTATTSIVTSMSETRRSRGHFGAFRGNRIRHRLAGLRWAMNRHARLKIAKH